MHYNILEARIEFNQEQLERVTVLVDCTSGSSAPLTDVRAIYATTKNVGGYMHLLPDSTISPKLLQQVAGYGVETMDRDTIFQNWKSKYARKG